MPSSRDLAVAVLREPLVHFLVAGALVFLCAVRTPAQCDGAADRGR
ncbi:MAG: hypothetical protein IPP45_10145 [Sphingomonadales bacterium]|nr:hypothetical protein [Sphingomonadales bacterium]